MVNVALLRRKVNLIMRDLERLKEYSHLTFDDVAKGWTAMAIVERLLEKLITRALDINRHIIAEIGTGTEKVYKGEESFLALGELGVISRDLARDIAPSAGLRNRLVHEYNDTDEKIIFASVGDAIKQYPSYCEAVLEFAKKTEERM